MKLAKTFSLWGFLSLWILILLSACSSQRIAISNPIIIPEDIMGLSPHTVSDPAEQLFMKELAVRWVRQGFFWNSIEPKPGIRDFSAYDTYLDHADAQGLKVLIVLDYDTDWIRPKGTSVPYIAPEYYPVWLDFVRDLVTRYKDRAGAFEIWNEPNLWRFWSGGKEEFAVFATLTARTVREYAPHAIITSPGFFTVPQDWIAACIHAGLFEYIDALAIHPYWVTAEDSLAMIDQAKSLVDKINPNLPIWLTEFGWPSFGFYVTATDEAGQATRLIKTALGASLRGVSKIFWYMSADYENADKPKNWFNPEGYFGLASRDFIPKPAARAYALLAHTLPGARYRPDILNYDGSLADELEVFPFEDATGTWTIFLWSRSPWSCSIEFKHDGGNMTLLKYLDTNGNEQLSTGKLTLTSTPVILRSDGPIRTIKLLRSHP